MSNAEFNIPATLTFVDKLESFSKCLANSKSEIETSVKNLGQYWKDPKFLEFQEEFKQHFNDLEDLRQAIESYQEYVLKDLLPDMEEYLKNSIQ